MSKGKNKILVALGFHKDVKAEYKVKLKDGKEILLTTEEIEEDTVAFESEGNLLEDGSYETEKGQKFSIKGGELTIEEEAEEGEFLTKQEFQSAFTKLVELLAEQDDARFENLKGEIDGIKQTLSKTPAVAPVVQTNKEPKKFDLKDPLSLMQN